MNAKFLLTASLCFLPFSAFSSDYEVQKQQEEIEKNMQELSAQMLSTVNSVSAGINQTLPQISKALSNIMQNMVAEMSPVMLALEKNKELLKANEQMAHSLGDTLPAVYSENLSYNINPDTNELSVKANFNKNGNNVRFSLNRNIAYVYYTDSLINKLNAGTASLTEKVSAPNGREVPLSAFKVQRINGQNFMVYDNNQNNETIAMGNIGSQISVTIQTSGPKHKELAEDFILSLNPQNIKKAVGITQPEETADDIKKAIDAELKQINAKPKMIKLFPHSEMPD